MAIDWRTKVYDPLGFHKGYNFWLFCIFAGATIGFVLARLPFIVPGIDYFFCHYNSVMSLMNLSAAPGECYNYDIKRGIQRLAIQLHLATVLPAMFLAAFQFLPVIRHKILTLHRVDGYIIIVFMTVAHVCALILGRGSFEGAIDTQTAVGIMVTTSLISMYLALYNIKRLQIEEHRAWMLRSFFYACGIITERLVLVFAVVWTTFTDNYYYIQPCYKIAYASTGNAMGRHPTVDRYPVCESYFNGTNPQQRAIVRAVFLNYTGFEEPAASLDMNFGMSMFMGWIINGIGVEIYLRLTSAEHERLRKISYEKQLARGYLNPGYSGTTASRLGDAPPWYPMSEKERALEDDL